jgi:hypothetical protein
MWISSTPLQAQRRFAPAAAHRAKYRRSLPHTVLPAKPNCFAKPCAAAFSQASAYIALEAFAE